MLIFVDRFHTNESGFTLKADQGYNPCVEISLRFFYFVTLHPRAVVDGEAGAAPVEVIGQALVQVSVLVVVLVQPGGKLAGLVGIVN